MVNHIQICNDMLTFRDNAYLTSIIYSVQKNNSPIQGLPCWKIPHYHSKNWLNLPTNWHVPHYFAQKNTAFAIYMQFLNLIKMFLPQTRLSLQWGMGRGGGIPPFARQKLANSPTWKNSPNRLHHSVHFPSNKGFLGKRVMTFFRG